MIPVANWEELQELRPLPFGEAVSIERGVVRFSQRPSEAQWRSLYPVSSLTQLLIRFGIVLEHIPATSLFFEVRQRARQVVDWRGKRPSADSLVPLPIRDLDHKPDPNYPMAYLRDRTNPGDIAGRLCHSVVPDRAAAGSQRGTLGPPGQWQVDGHAALAT